MELPVCRWRGKELTPGRYACSSPKLVIGPRGVSAATCAACYCCDHTPGAAPASPAPGVPAPCLHLGPPTGETVTCPSCVGEVRVKLRGCAVYGKCAPAKQLPGVAYCVTCRDYRAAGGAGN